MVTEALKLRSNKHVSKPITACLPAWLLHQWHSHGMATLFMMSSQNPTKELHTLAKPRNWHLKQSLDGVLCFGLGFTHSLFQGSSVSPQGYICDFIMCILNVLIMSWQADVLPYYHYTLLLYCPITAQRTGAYVPLLHPYHRAVWILCEWWMQDTQLNESVWHIFCISLYLMSETL